MSRPPLIRPGTGQAGVHHALDEIARQQRQLDRMIATANLDDHDLDRRSRGIIGRRSAAGDELRLRGIPVCTEGVAGHIPGTRP